MVTSRLRRPRSNDGRAKPERQQDGGGHRGRFRLGRKIVDPEIALDAGNDLVGLIPH